MRGVEFRTAGLEVTEGLADEVLTLPCFPEMTDGEVEEVAGAIWKTR